MPPGTYSGSSPIGSSASRPRGAQMAISKLNSSGLFAGKWLRAPDLNQRPTALTGCFRRSDLWITAPKVKGPSGCAEESAR
jgi:hypothetical protein